MNNNLIGDSIMIDELPVVTEITSQDNLVIEKFGQGTSKISATILQGIQGEKGDKGDPGVNGEKGDPGVNGQDGVLTAEQETTLSKVEPVVIESAANTQELIEVNTQLVKNEIVSFNSNVGTRNRKKAILTIIDDDGKMEVNTHLRRALSELKVPIVSALITDRVQANDGSSINLEQIRELEKLGMEFVSHTASHMHLNQVTEQEAYEECKKSSEWLNNNNLNGRCLVYPFGDFNDAVKKICSEFFDTCVNVDHNMTATINYPPVKPFALYRVYYEQGLEAVKAKIDETVENGGWMILGMHCFYPEWDYNTFKAIVDYAKTKDIDILNMKDATAIYNNKLNLGEAKSIDDLTDCFVVDKNGKIHGRQMACSFVMDTSKPIGDIIENSAMFKSMSYIASSNASAYPERSAGVLETNRMPNELYSYRLYKPINSNNLYISNWKDNAWTAFEKITISNASKLFTTTLSDLVANTTRDYPLSSGLFKEGGHLVLTFKTLLPAGVTAQIFSNGAGKGILRLTNVTAEVKAIGLVSFNVLCLI